MPNAIMTGIVSEIPTPKEFTNKFGKTMLLHSFKLQGDNRWFRCGTRQLPASVGDAIQFSYDVEKNNVEVESVRPVPREAVAKGPDVAAAAGRARTAGGSKDAYWTDKEARDIERERYNREVVQPRIEFQSARRDAVSLLPVLLANEAVPGITAKTAPNKKLAAIMACLAEVTADLLAMSAAEGVVATEAAPADEEANYDE
jgi:hypothetical protein